MFHQSTFRLKKTVKKQANTHEHRECKEGFEKKRKRERGRKQGAEKGTR
jgi:hypothetical protein